jgi:hypothetical protein
MADQPSTGSLGKIIRRAPLCKTIRITSRNVDLIQFPRSIQNRCLVLKISNIFG